MPELTPHRSNALPANAGRKSHPCHQAPRVAWLAALMLASHAMISSGHASGDKELGEYLSSQCTTCHQVSGKANGIPSIVGWDTDSFVAVMNAYKKKERDNKVMQTIAGTLSPEDIAALAAYFGSLKPKQ